eukprot:1441488-Prymnesium_polylepis.1
MAVLGGEDAQGVHRPVVDDFLAGVPCDGAAENFAVVEGAGEHDMHGVAHLSGAKLVAQVGDEERLDALALKFARNENSVNDDVAGGGGGGDGVMRQMRGTERPDGVQGR